MELYNDTCFECSKLITNKYSTSFSKGIKVFDKRFRGPVYAIYGFVRCADEIVDTFHGHDQRRLMHDFKEQAFKAIREKVSMNPVLQSFQFVVNTYHIEEKLIEAFLTSMEMDLDRKRYDPDGYAAYVHGSAEVIGLMCLRVFCENNNELYQQLRPSACSLGAAFQKVNFLRDIKDDHTERGRIYFPGVNFSNFTNEAKKHIETDIEKDFTKGLEGIKLLPDGVRLGVYVAYVYYTELLKKISNTPATIISRQRIRITDISKTILYIRAVLKYKLTGI